MTVPTRELLAAVILATGALSAAPARADQEVGKPPTSGDLPSAPAPEPEPEDKVDFMHVLARRGLTDLKDERANAYGQITLIGSYKAPFHAPYSNLGGALQSLSPAAEGSWTASATLYLGLRLWRGAEAYVVPEVISERPFSHLAGLGSTIQNGELQKTGSASPTLYMSRVFLRQTIGLGGAPVEKKSDMSQLGTTVDARRLVITVGKLSVLDVFDRSSVAGDVRRQFLNMAFMAHAAYDFGADARGYTWGAVAELYFDDWALRLARVTGPDKPNQLSMDYRFWDHYGDQIELEHAHKIRGQPGVVRLLGYRNREPMGRFDDAIAAYRADPRRNAGACDAAGRFNYYSPPDRPGPSFAPDLCWARKDNVKMGIGVNLEQRIADDFGVFFRGMYSDGQTEVYAYTSTDRSISFGTLAKGTLWRRPADNLGLAFGMGWISSQHAAYLGMGGVDGFIGDGSIRQAAESVFEVLYTVNVVPSLWLTADYQRITHPAYNADRGPVDVVSGRLHSEF